MNSTSIYYLLFAHGHLWPGGWSYPDRLDIYEFAYAERGKLSSIAAAFDSAKWQTRIGGRHAVDEDSACLDAMRQFAGTLYVLGPQIAAEPKW